MQLNELSPGPGSRKHKRRLGRGAGSGLGKTSGKGHKGQKARAGGSVRPGFEGGQMPLHRRLPKIGFSNKRFKKVYQLANVGDFEARGVGEGEIGPVELAAAGLIRSATRPVKVLGRGDLKIGVQVRAHAFSGSAIEKIQAAGGTAEALK